MDEYSWHETPPEEILIEEILRHKRNLTREDLERLIREKIEDFGGVIKREAAVYLLAKEMGINFLREFLPASLTALRVRDLAVGLRNVDVEGVVVSMYPLSVTSGGKQYLRFALADREAIIWSVAWGEKALELSGMLTVGKKVLVKAVSVKKYREKNELIIDKNSSVEVLGDVSFDELLRIAKTHSLRLHALSVVHVAKESGRIFLYGFDEECNPAVAVLPVLDRFSLEITPGSTLLLDNCGRSTVGEYNYLVCRENSNVLKVQRRDGCSDTHASRFYLEGYVLGFEIFRREGGRVYLLVNGKPEPLVLFRDSLLSSLAALSARKARIWGLRRTDGTLREAPFTQVEALGEQLQLQVVKGKKLLECSGLLEATLTLVSADLRFRCIDGRPLYTVYLVFDDGTATIRAVSNSPQILEEVYELQESDLCELESSVIEKIKTYRVERIGGLEYATKIFVNKFSPKTGFVFSLRSLG
ncbi:hypothetical protein [Thermofilum pendens]|nr:hypothetical protein [Thermofilum pendens]